MLNPMLTIGLPVYNGERFLARALDSFLGQSFTDFVLLISDNASTDRTEEIARDYAARDRRIRYSRNPENIGAGKNFLRVYNLAEGKYYKHAAHDDYCEPTFLETCIAALENDPQLVLAYTKTRIVDSDGLLIEEYECPMNIGDADPVVRFAEQLLISHRCFHIFGVHRMSALRQLPPMGSYPHADGVLLAQLALLGRFYEAPGRLFVSTRHSGQSVFTLASRSTRRGFHLSRRVGRLPSLEWWDPARRREVSLPEHQILYRYCESVRSSALTPAQKMRSYGVIARWAFRYRRKLMGDFVLAADQMFWKWQSRHDANWDSASGIQ